MNSSAESWLESQISGFRALEGRSIVGWRACEMALGGDEGGPPEGLIWHHYTVPMLQLWRLDLELGDGLAKVRIAQADDIWGLHLPADAGVLGPDMLDGIFRVRSLSELPVGLISNVVVAIEHDMVAAVEPLVGGRRVSLVAGEVYEEADGFRVQLCDESILVQVDGDRPVRTQPETVS